MNKTEEKLQTELWNAEIVNRAVESDKVIKAIEELGGDLE